VKQDVESAMAMLVAGEDRHGHFELLDPPESDDPAVTSRRRSEIIERMYSNLMPDE
jgi:hypothetical protein